MQNPRLYLLVNLVSNRSENEICIARVSSNSLAEAVAKRALEELASSQDCRIEIRRISGLLEETINKELSYLEQKEINDRKG